jgi:hypothetical protein
MESADMKSHQSDDAQIEARLRENNPAPLPDNGFSARVLAALPPKTKNFADPREWFGIGLLAALALILEQGSFLDKMRAETASLDGALAPLFTVMADPLLLLVCAITAGAWVLTSDDEESPFEPPSAA